MSCISDLPDEVLEYILILVSPYQDLHNCMAVSKRWKKCVKNVVKTRKRNFNKCLSDFNVCWSRLTPSKSYSSISQRYSHSAVIHDNYMYVFGGCTCAMTTFNDLWKFDLSTREWSRLLATGTNPSPKACSTLVYYNDILILFGGWTYPPSYSFHQNWHLFNELHIYSITQNEWKVINRPYCPPPMAGHSASIIGKSMIVFGGFVKLETEMQFQKTNDVWSLDLEDWTWTKRDVKGLYKPEGRFGQTQIVLNEENILIIGGSRGSGFMFNDAWILNTSEENSWNWKQLEIRGKSNKPSDIWSNCGCKVNDKLVILNPMSTDFVYPATRGVAVREPYCDRRISSSSRIDHANREPDLDENVNGKRGTLRIPRRDPLRSNQVGNCYVPWIKRDLASEKEKKNFLGLCVLDLQRALNPLKPHVTWLCPKNYNRGPEQVILYTLLMGKSELIVFGGISLDSNTTCDENREISNSIYIISATNEIV